MSGKEADATFSSNPATPVPATVAAIAAASLNSSPFTAEQIFFGRPQHMARNFIRRTAFASQQQRRRLERGPHPHRGHEARGLHAPVGPPKNGGPKPRH